MKKAPSNRGAMGSAPAKDIDAYLASVPPDARAALEKLRRTIKAAAPKAEESISYMMPAFRYHGPLVYFAAFKDHLSFFPAGKSVLTKFSRELASFDASGGTIRFSTKHPLPTALVKKIVKLRASENEAKARKK